METRGDTEGEDDEGQRRDDERERMEGVVPTLHCVRFSSRYIRLNCIYAEESVAT